MKFLILTGLLAIICMSCSVNGRVDPYKSDQRPPAEIQGMKLVWNDEFNNDGKPDPSGTEFPVKYEVDYVRVYKHIDL